MPTPTGPPGHPPDPAAAPDLASAADLAAAAAGVPAGPASIPGPAATPGPAAGAPAGMGIDPEERTPRSFHLSRQILERARAAAYWLSRRPGDAGPTTISELVESALRQEVERLEQEHNEGTPFPAVVGRMRTGPGAAGAERIRRAQRARRRTDG